jgi:hypothetical protein
MAEFKPTPNKMICSKVKECGVISCPSKTPHNKDRYCEGNCDGYNGIPEDSKCVPVPLTGVELIADERRRQIEVEGWTSAHDDCEQLDFDLASVGALYALHATLEKTPNYSMLFEKVFSYWYPWDKKYWKPTAPDDPIRQLTKAGALIATEIDRLQRQYKS